MTIAKIGTLYGIGTGPGDPELVTRKAWRITSEAKVIAYPSTTDGDSFARRIMADAISPHAIEIAMPVPMTAGRAPAQAIYDAGADAIRRHLNAGDDVAVLCEGDPLFYGSFMYILARLRDDFPTEVIPGVTSMTASAAAHNHALVARNDALTVLTGGQDDAVLSARIDQADAVVIMKVGRYLGRIRDLLKHKGLIDTALYVSHASLPHQRALPLVDAPTDAPYFSMILLYKGDDPWI
ncbi:MAG: precorrin-2 C(20)-methyltransferase [Candidatus Puniceispirillales bacterium WSBS_2018_MAG_OTU23]